MAIIEYNGPLSWRTFDIPAYGMLHQYLEDEEHAPQAQHPPQAQHLSIATFMTANPANPYMVDFDAKKVSKGSTNTSKEKNAPFKYFK